MTMRFKVVPEDFVVEERARLPLSVGGAYAVYRVRKRGVTTLQVQERLAARLRVPKSAVVFPALKDKDAVAVQYACVKGGGPGRLTGAGFSAEFLGRCARPLSPRDLEGNRFTVVLRDLMAEEVEHIRARLGQVTRFGVPNYFDLQRFGSYAPGEGFMGKKILQRDAEGALRAYLTLPFAGDPPRVRAFKAFAREHWEDWPLLFERAPRPSNFRSVLTFLRDHPEDFRRALNLVPARLLSLFLSAYQSFLWNRMAGRYLRGKLEASGLPFASIQVLGEELPVHRELPDGLLRALSRTNIPLLHHRARFEDPDVAALAEAVLTEEGLSQWDLKARLLERAYLPRGTRPLLTFPQEASALGAEEDELFPGRRKLTLAFSLPPGSYATLVLKALVV